MGNRTRQFSLTRPIMYQEEYYPSAEADISYGNGVENNGRIFVDANGNYFTLGSNGNALEAMVEQNLPETVVLPDKKNLLSKQFNDYLAISTDNTRVSNLINGNNSPLVNKAMSETNNYYSSQDKNNENGQGNYFYKLLNYIDPETAYNRYANSLSPYTFQDDKDRTGKISQGPLTTGNEVSSRLGNLGLVKVGDNSYRLYDEKGNTIKQCAKTRNELEKMVGRPTTNNAWDTFGMYGDSTLFNGYPQKNRTI